MKKLAYNGPYAVPDDEALLQYYSQMPEIDPYYSQMPETDTPKGVALAEPGAALGTGLGAGFGGLAGGSIGAALGSSGALTKAKLPRALGALAGGLPGAIGGGVVGGALGGASGGTADILRKSTGSKTENKMTPDLAAILGAGGGAGGGLAVSHIIDNIKSHPIKTMGAGTIPGRAPMSGKARALMALLGAGVGAAGGAGIGKLLSKKEASGGYDVAELYKIAKAKKVISTLFGPKVKHKGKMAYKWKADAQEAGQKFKKNLFNAVKKTAPGAKSKVKKALPYAAAVAGGAGMHNAVMQHKAKKDQNRVARSETKEASEIAMRVLYKLASTPREGVGFDTRFGRR